MSHKNYFTIDPAIKRKRFVIAFRRSVLTLPQLLILIAIVLIVGGVLGFILSLGPHLLVQTKGNITAAEHLNAENDVRTTLIQAIAASVVLGGLWFTGRTYKASRGSQITERFSRAISHLGDDKESVRIGALYALERIARDSSRGSTVVEVIVGFIRANAERYDPGTADPTSSVSLDIQVALSVLGRRSGTSHEIERLQLGFLNLHGANLTRGDWRNMDFGYSYLHEAKFMESVYDGTCFHHAVLSNAAFTNVRAKRLCGRIGRFLSGRRRSGSTAATFVMLTAILAACDPTEGARPVSITNDLPQAVILRLCDSFGCDNLNDRIGSEQQTVENVSTSEDPYDFLIVDENGRRLGCLEVRTKPLPATPVLVSSMRHGGASRDCR